MQQIFSALLGEVARPRLAPYAENRLQEHKREALEQFLSNRLVASLASPQDLNAKDFRRARFAFVI